VPLTETVVFGVATAADRFEQAIAEHHQRLAGLAFVLTGDGRVTEDLLAEAYAKVWGRYRRNQIDDLGPYLRRAVVNLARSRRRRWRVERRYAEAYPPFKDGAGRGVDDEVTARHSVHGALLTLPVDQRAVVVLRLLVDLSEAETARLLRVRPGTVKSRLARGLDALRAELERTGEES
jgi:RNA polymerase sigma-70 factor (sigma-E family)